MVQLLRIIHFYWSQKKTVVTTNTQPKGRWYFEVTHISGDNCPLIGFSHNDKMSQCFTITSNLITNKWRIYYYREINVNINSFTPITSYTDISDLGQYESQFTMGFAYDMYTHLFTVFYKNKFSHFNISGKNSCEEKIFPVFIESTSSGSTIYKDVLKVNFGGEPFKYGLPYGYLPWNSYLPMNNCNTNNRFQTHIFIYNHVFILFCSIY